MIKFALRALVAFGACVPALVAAQPVNPSIAFTQIDTDTAGKREIHAFELDFDGRTLNLTSSFTRQKKEPEPRSGKGDTAFLHFQCSPKEVSAIFYSKGSLAQFLVDAGALPPLAMSKENGWRSKWETRDGATLDAMLISDGEGGASIHFEGKPVLQLLATLYESRFLLIRLAHVKDAQLSPTPSVMIFRSDVGEIGRLSLAAIGRSLSFCEAAAAQRR